MTQITRRQYEAARDAWRDLALSGLDNAMLEVCRALHINPSSDGVGACDADLPELFRALDAQLARNLARRGIEVPEPV